MAYKDHTMGKGKARVTTRNKAAHDALEKDGWGHGPFKMKGFSYPGKSPIMKKGPCWEGYEMIGMKKKGGRNVPNCVPKK